MNLVTQFYKIINKIFSNLIFIITIPFLNNINIYSLYINYNKNKVVSKVKKYILKHIQVINKTFKQIKYISYLIKAKLKQCFNNINIVDYIVKTNEKYLVYFKIVKIMEQPEYKTVTEICMFLKVYIYYKI